MHRRATEEKEDAAAEDAAAEEREPESELATMTTKYGREEAEIAVYGGRMPPERRF